MNLHEDFEGTKLKVNDAVIISLKAYPLCRGKIIKLTPKKITVEYTVSISDYWDNDNKKTIMKIVKRIASLYGEQIVKIK